MVQWEGSGRGLQGVRNGTTAAELLHSAVNPPDMTRPAVLVSHCAAITRSWTHHHQCEQVLKAHGHLLPPALEALAEEQRTEDREAARQLRASAEGAALVTVQAALRPGLKPEGLLPELERTRSQRLLAVLREPGVQALLAEASEDVVNGRVLAAHDRLKAALQAAGGSSLAELAALSPEALSAALPPGTILDVAGVAADVAFVHEALEALEDHKGWMVSRSDALKVYYRHQRGTTVHRCGCGCWGAVTLC